MINFINTVLQFDFVIDTYFPLLVKLLIIISGFIASLFIFAIISALIENVIPIISKIIDNILIIISTIGIIIVILFILMIFILPILLTSIALKFYLMGLILNNEFINGIISIIICIFVTAIIAGLGINIIKD